MATEQDCIEALQDAAQRLGESPTKAQYEQMDITPSASAILRHCGGWNDAKQAAGLETSYSTGSRVQEKPQDVELPDGLAWEELSQDQRWHYKNREWNTKRSMQRQDRQRAWVHEIKQDRGCRDCGETDAACLDFHHRDETAKWMKVSKLVNLGYGLSDIRAEIAKCDVLCANCHRLEHVRIPPEVTWERVSDPEAVASSSCVDAVILPDSPQRQRAWVSEYKQIQGCRDCGNRQAGCHDFHHLQIEQKVHAVSQLIVRGYSGAALFDEIRKCEVLCANCHRKEHYRKPNSVGNVSVVDGIVHSD